MPNNFYEDTSYKYRHNQKELLGKILSGTLDEDLYISNLRMTKLPSNSSTWKLNPIFLGRCFTGKHKLHIGIDWTNNSTAYIGQNTFASLFSGIANVTHLHLNIKYSGSAESANMPLSILCNNAKDLLLVEVCAGNDKTYLTSFHSAFENDTVLKTVILRSAQIKITSDHFIGNSAVDTLVLDSPVIATLSYIAGMNTIFKSGGTGGTIYIPKSLYDHLGDGTEYDYKAATNWSTLDGYGTITWAQIEGSEYELT